MAIWGKSKSVICIILLKVSRTLHVEMFSVISVSDRQETEAAELDRATHLCCSIILTASSIPSFTCGLNCSSTYKIRSSFLIFVYTLLLVLFRSISWVCELLLTVVYVLKIKIMYKVWLFTAASVPDDTGHHYMIVTTLLTILLSFGYSIITC